MSPLFVPRWLAIVILVFSLILIGFGIGFMMAGPEVLILTLLFMGGGIYLALHALSWLIEHKRQSSRKGQ